MGMVLSSSRGRHGQAMAYLDSRDFTEPMFVFAVMVVAGSRPILRLAHAHLGRGASATGPAGGVYFAALSLVPLLGSLIPSPAMTLDALMLRDDYLAAHLQRLKYATLGGSS